MIDGTKKFFERRMSREEIEGIALMIIKEAEYLSRSIILYGGVFIARDKENKALPYKLIVDHPPNHKAKLVQDLESELDLAKKRAEAAEKELDQFDQWNRESRALLAASEARENVLRQAVELIAKMYPHDHYVAGVVCRKALAATVKP